MKVIIVINTLGAGGAERSMVEFAKYLHRKEGVSVKFVCFEHRKVGIEAEVIGMGIEVHFFEGKGRYFSKAKFINKVLEKEKPDIVHSALADSNIVLRLSRLRSKRGKLVQSLVNTPYSLERKKDNNLPWYKFQLAKQLDIITARMNPDIYYHAITREVLNHYRPLFKIKDNFRIIYRGRNENPYLEDSESKKEFTLINVGRQEFAKGQVDIVKALAILKSERGIDNIKLEILGRPGHYSEVIKKSVRENDLDDQVSLIGFVDNVQQRLVKADVFVFPSYYEGLGGSLIEAFSSRLPCICSNIPVLKEVVGSDHGALFSPPGDFRKLADHILQLYEDKKLRQELGNYSYRRFQESFRLEKINSEMMNMYEEIRENSGCS